MLSRDTHVITKNINSCLELQRMEFNKIALPFSK